MKTTQRGNEGEQIAVYFLQQNGYTILEQNYRYQRAEVDVICKKDDIVIFVEVKTRTSNQFGEPEQSVTVAKQNHLARAADEYIYKTNHEGEMRFDIISIKLSKQDVSEILHLEDAFFPTK